MAHPPRAATIKTSAALMATQRGPTIPHYNVPLDIPVLFQWVPGATDTVDSVTVFSSQGGTSGRWRRVRMPLQGDDLPDADVTVDPRGNYVRVVPSATLTAARIATMGTTNAVEGDVITIVRICTAAYTYTINNGGPGGGTLATFPVQKEAFADLYFDGTNWIKIRAAQML